MGNEASDYNVLVECDSREEEEVIIPILKAQGYDVGDEVGMTFMWSAKPYCLVINCAGRDDMERIYSELLPYYAVGRLSPEP